ncbi:hypothetical protein JKP88DRAFT_253851 [Tribonema minus]|uniref:Uncharacterized protein n=1 Tax=Tribonema minus TaxID=303371 RepID=A0A835Z6A3_9STRA|nr:hypothetical protein JKP88DRAFT_253851 [Tribonema minus]
MADAMERGTGIPMLAAMDAFRKGDRRGMPVLVLWTLLEGVVVAAVVAAYTNADKRKAVVLAAILTLGISVCCVVQRARLKHSSSGAANTLSNLLLVYVAWGMYHQKKRQEPSLWFSAFGAVTAAVYLRHRKGTTFLPGHSVIAVVTLFLEVLNCCSRITEAERAGTMHMIRILIAWINGMFFVQSSV